MAYRARPARLTLRLLAIGTIACGARPAASSPSLVDALRACASRHDAAVRLECFDRLARQATATTAGATSMSSHQPPNAPAQAAPSLTSNTGLERSAGPPSSVASIPATEPAKPPADGPRRADEVADFGTRGGPLDERHEARGLRQISAVVTRIGHRPYGQLVVALDNGQVWLQREPTDYFPLKAGDAVIIRRAALGSFLLFAPFKRSTRVTRIR